MSTGHRKHHHEINDTLVSSEMLSKAVADILTRVHLDRDHDIPYDVELIKAMQRAMVA